MSTAGPSPLISAVDHVPVVVADLDVAVAAYSTLLGRTPNWRGRLEGARHAWFQLPNIALDIIAADGEGPGAAAIRARLAKYGEGPAAIAWRTPDLDETVRRLGRRAIQFGATGVTRSLDEDGRERTWRYAEARQSTTRGLMMMWIEQAPDAARWPVSPPVTDQAAAVSSIDHIVVRTANADGCVALYGGRLGLDLRLDRANAAWNAHQLFFACNDMVIEAGAAITPDPARAGERDTLGGLAWRVSDPHAARARLAAAGIDVSEVRKGRKPGTEVFTIRSGVPGAPYLMLKPSPEPA
jgi:catechol 2,3-dioxygenase-like lactoylglutathione lyase family enzyme